jgi:hypothetical protein
MKKEELVHLYMLLAQLKRYCEENDLNCDFSKYDKLGISPFHVHQSKEGHKPAIFLLVTELASMTSKRHPLENKRTSGR